MEFWTLLSIIMGIVGLVMIFCGVFLERFSKNAVAIVIMGCFVLGEAFAIYMSLTPVA